MKEQRNKDIRDQLKDFPMKAPEGLLDDVKSEMLRRGLSPAPALHKQKHMAIYRIASVAAMLFILLSISLLWKKEAEIQLESHIIPSSVEEVTSPMLEEEEEEQMSTPATPRPTQALGMHIFSTSDIYFLLYELHRYKESTKKQWLWP